MLSQPGLGTCQWCFSASSRKSSDSPSGNGTQLHSCCWPHSNTGAFHHSAPPSSEPVRSSGEEQCVQLGCFVMCSWGISCLSVMCLCLCRRSQSCPGMAALLPAFVILLGSRILDSPRGLPWGVRVPKASGLSWALAGINVDVAVSRGLMANQVMPPGSQKDCSKSLVDCLIWV